MTLAELIRWHKSEASLYDREGYFAEKAFHDQALELLTRLAYQERERKVSA